MQDSITSLPVLSICGKIETNKETGVITFIELNRDRGGTTCYNAEDKIKGCETIEKDGFYAIECGGLPYMAKVNTSTEGSRVEYRFYFDAATLLANNSKLQKENNDLKNALETEKNASSKLQTTNVELKKLTEVQESALNARAESQQFNFLQKSGLAPETAAQSAQCAPNTQDFSTQKDDEERAKLEQENKNLKTIVSNVTKQLVKEQKERESKEQEQKKIIEDLQRQLKEKQEQTDAPKAEQGSQKDSEAKQDTQTAKKKKSKKKKGKGDKPAEKKEVTQEEDQLLNAAISETNATLESMLEDRNIVLRKAEKDINSLSDKNRELKRKNTNLQDLYKALNTDLATRLARDLSQVDTAGFLQEIMLYINKLVNGELSANAKEQNEALILVNVYKRVFDHDELASRRNEILEQTKKECEGKSYDEVVEHLSNFTLLYGVVFVQLMHARAKIEELGSKLRVETVSHAVELKKLVDDIVELKKEIEAWKEQNGGLLQQNTILKQEVHALEDTLRTLKLQDGPSMQLSDTEVTSKTEASTHL